MEVATMTKDKFWNELERTCPVPMKAFCAWIHEYKKRVNWNGLFNADSTWQDSNGKNAPAPKYHDLPDAMQVGIFLQYCIESKDGYWFLNEMIGTYSNIYWPPETTMESVLAKFIKEIVFFFSAEQKTSEEAEEQFREWVGEHYTPSPINGLWLANNS